MRELKELAALSRKYGSDQRFVFLGGGNTSWKTDDKLYIKPSGTRLAAIQAEDFILLDRSAVRRIFDESLPENIWEREAVVKALLQSAVRPISDARPSVESPVHEVIKYSYVFHLHPAVINGMTCGKTGKAVCAELFPEALWLDYTNPGFTLAHAVQAALAKAEQAAGRQPQVIFLQNHGVFVGAESCAEIESIYAHLLATLQDYYLKKNVSLQLQTQSLDMSAAMEYAPQLRSLLKNGEQRAAVHCCDPFTPAAGPLTPDHAIYARSFPFSGKPSASALAAYEQNYGYQPKVLACPDAVVFCSGDNLKSARETVIAAEDAALVQQLAGAFDGPRFLHDEERLFLENWEVESYRRKVLAGGAQLTRLNHRICLVTGAAQGFGRGIAEGLVAAGGVVFLADLNLDGATKVANSLNEKYGPSRAIPLKVNIADEASVVEMMRAVVQECGGIDLFVANAGVLRAGSVKELSKKDWDFVTNVNYTGYFLCVKHVSVVMAAQTVTDDSDWSDIVQINSKSGLEGSNRNGAYAGSKFGTIGLTQSFAKELVEDRIKVNSICPGNFFDGPLWSDPENGLFVQYLRTGKVPGAKTIADVRKAYEKQVPMGRGCLPEDVVRAILYTVEQKYETGQAIPVTGGQLMLR